MPNSRTRPNHEVQAQRLATNRSRYGRGAVIPFEDVTGMVYGQLVAVERVQHGTGHTKWLFRCSCGTAKECRLSHVKAGRTTSCGCAQHRLVVERFTTHGLSNSPTYRSWQAMRNRCYNQKHRQYKDYGGRGIKVCERWRGSFSAFLKDMGPRTDRSLTLDRINNDGNYEPGNCRWATRSEQRRNSRHASRAASSPQV